MSIGIEHVMVLLMPIAVEDVIVFYDVKIKGIKLVK